MIKTTLKIIFFTVFLSELQIFAAPMQISENQIWMATSEQSKELIRESKFTEALTALKTFEKSFPTSQKIPQLRFKMAIVYLENLSQLETGYAYFENAVSTGQGFKFDPSEGEIRSKYGSQITILRLNRLTHYLEKYFISEINFPSSLEILRQKYPEIKKYDFSDGYGSPMIYELKNNPIYKTDNSWSYVLYSSGADKIDKTSDDLYPPPATKQPISLFKLIQTFKTDNEWNAEIKYFDTKKKYEVIRKVQQNDTVGDYFVFGINENGVVFLKDNRPVIVSLDSNIVSKDTN